jgi:hypothetical protein
MMMKKRIQKRIPRGFLEDLVFLFLVRLSRAATVP